MVFYEILVASLIAITLGLIIYMTKEIWKTDSIRLSGRNFLLSIIGVIFTIIVIGNLLITAVITALIQVIFTPFLLVLGIIFLIVGIFFFGKIIRQL